MNSVLRIVLAITVSAIFLAGCDQISGGSDVAVLDLAAVSFISSAGLTAMLTAQSRLKAAGGSLTVQNPTPAVERMFSLSGLTTLLGGSPNAS